MEDDDNKEEKLDEGEEEQGGDDGMQPVSNPVGGVFISAFLEFFLSFCS